MFPLSDSTPQRTVPFVNYGIIILTVLVFYLQVTAADFESFVYQYAFIPADFNLLDPHSYRFIFFSMFLHGDIMHIVSNMWFLKIFGDNVEDSLGHFSYLLFYLVGGAVAAMGQYIIDPSSQIPMVGASGAISAAAGLYFVHYNRASVRTLLILFYGFIRIVSIPVWAFLGYWFVTQLLLGIASLGTIGGSEGGIAYMVHVTGFVFGCVLGFISKNSDVEKPVEILSG